MNENRQAIVFLESNQMEKAFKMFKKSALKSRNVQSLNNLAYFYAKEMDENDRAIALLEEAISLNPTSYFPYAFLGQLLIEEGNFKEALPHLLKANSFEETKEVTYNIAVCYYMLSEYEKAIEFFSLLSQESNNAHFSLARSLFNLGKKKESEDILRNYNARAELFSDDLFCETDIAELYMELGFFQDSVDWFEKAWKSHVKDYEWVLGYVYCLIKLNQLDKASSFLQTVISEKKSDIIEEENDVEFDDHWTEEDKKEKLVKMNQELKQFENMTTNIQNGFVPKKAFDPAYQVKCYLFGCTRHNHPEYKENN